jgi:hypothetical protein
MVIRQMRWHQKSGKWYVTESSNAELVKAAELNLARPLRHSVVRSALKSRFEANPGVLAAIRNAPGEYTPVWDNNAGTILPVRDAILPTLEDDYSALDSSRA